MPVQAVSADAQLPPILQAAGDKLVMIDFYADWCGPCQRIAPFVEELSGRYPDVVFVKVDVDNCRQIGQMYGVTAMPTFIFLKSLQKVGELQGANPEALEGKLTELMQGGGGGAAAGAASGGATGGDGGCEVEGQMLLHEFIDKKQMECLNQKDSNPVQNLFTPGARLESDCDQQLIISVTFNQPVKVHSLAFGAMNDDESATLENGPRVVKLYTNHATTPDFSDVEDMAPIQELELAEASLKDTPVELRYVKFQNVTNLVIFVETNQDDNEDLTVINSLRIIGQPKEASNMADFKRVSGKAGESDH